MNVAFFLIPKAETAFLYEDDTLRQALEKMHYHGYTAIPVLSREGKYISTVSEGDFLWYLVQGEGGELYPTDIRDLQNLPLTEVLRTDRNPPIRITDTMENLLVRSLNQNFIPVTDDRDIYIGLITRRDIIQYFYEHSLPEGVPAALAQSLCETSYVAPQAKQILRTANP